MALVERPVYSFASRFSSPARSVFSQAKPGPVRPKWPYAAVSPVYRTLQAQVLDYAFWREVENLAYEIGDLIVGTATRPEGVDMDGNRFGDADGVGKLQLAAVGETGGDDVLGDVAGHVMGAAVYLGRILARKGSPSVRTHATISIDDDLAASQPAVAVRTSDDEAPRRIDVKNRVPV